MSQGEILLVKKKPPRLSSPKFTPLSSDLVKHSFIDPWLRQLVDAAGCPMTINTYELALTGGEALLLPQFSCLLLCGFAASKIGSSWWVGFLLFFIGPCLFNLFRCMDRAQSITIIFLGRDEASILTYKMMERHSGLVFFSGTIAYFDELYIHPNQAKKIGAISIRSFHKANSESNSDVTKLFN